MTDSVNTEALSSELTDQGTVDVPGSAQTPPLAELNPEISSDSKSGSPDQQTTEIKPQAEQPQTGDSQPQTEGPDTKKEVPEDASSIASDPEQKDEKSAEPKKTKKKRLTLQERLALATKTKEKKDALSAKASQGNSATTEETTPPAEPAKSSPDQEGKEEQKPTEELESQKNDEQLQKLIQENQQLKAELAKASKTKAQQELQKKDEIINQLMQEGEQLSIKELKLNDTIKKLKTTTADYEQVIEEMSQKNEESISRLTELDETLKNSKVKTVQELSRIVAEYNHMKSQNLSQKIQEKSKSYEEEVKKVQLKTRELNELKIQFDLVKESHALELANKDEIIKGLRTELSNINSANSKEIIRLENKIETLTMENEQKQGAYSNGGSGPGNSDGDSTDFAKLLKNYNNLQTEMLNSKSNWDLIEINLNSKVSDLTSRLDGLKKEKLQLIGELKIIRNRLADSDSSVAELTEKIQTLQDDISKKDVVIDDLQLEVSNLNEKLVKMNQIFNNEKQALNAQVKDLEEKAAEQKFERQTRPRGRHPIQEQYLEEQLDAFPSPSIPHPDGFEPMQSSNSHLETSMDNSFYNMGSHNVSSQSLVSNDIDNTASSIPFNSFQLINKLSSTVRTLKVELNSVKDENEQLNADKDKLERTLLQNSKRLSEIDTLGNKIKELEQELSKKVENEDNLLVLIGEKEERLEELRNDVQDLKELCKLQVQQMIEMQEKNA